jgi:phage-related protein
MATDRELAIRLSVGTGELSAGLARAAAAVKGWAAETIAAFDAVGESSEKIGNLWHGAFEAFIAVEAIEQLKKLGEAASDASDRMEIASQTARNLGHAFEADDAEKWLQKLALSAKGGGFSIDQLRASMTAFASIGADEAQQQRLTADAVGLAAMKHLDLAEATRILTLAATGHVALLGRYGIAIRDASGHLLTFTQMVKELERAMARDAALRAAGLEGAFGRLSTVLEDFVNGAFGKELAKIFDAATNALTRFLQMVNSLPAPVLATIAGLLAFSAAATAAFLGLGALAAVGGIFTAAFGAVDAFMVGAAAPAVLALGTIAAAAIALATHWKQVEVALEPVFEFLKDRFSDLEQRFSFIRTAVDGARAVWAQFTHSVGEMAAAFVALTGPIGIVIGVNVALGIAIAELATHWRQTTTFIAARVDDLHEMFVGLGEVFHSVGDVAREVWNSIADVVRAAINAIGDSFNYFDLVLGGTGNAFGDFQNSVADACKAILQVIEEMVKSAGTMLGGLSKQLSDTFLKLASATGVTGTGNAILGIGHAVLDHLDPTMRAGLERIAASLQRFSSGMSDAGKNIGKSFVDGLTAALKAGESGIDAIKKVFSSVLGPDPKDPNADLSNLGAPAKSGKDDTQKKITDSIASEKAAIESLLSAAAYSVSDARVNLDKAKADLDNFKASLPGGKVSTGSEALEEQKLVTAEIQRQHDLQATLNEQAYTFNRAAVALRKEAANLPANDKDRVVHAAELNKLADDYALAAKRARVEWENIRAAVHGLNKEMATALADVADGVQKAAESAAQLAYAMRAADIKAQREALSETEASQRRSKVDNPLVEAKDASLSANLDVEEAKNALTKALADLAAVMANAAATDDVREKSENAVSEAEEKLHDTQQNATRALQDYTDALRLSQLDLTNVVNRAAIAFSKLIPGLKVTQDSSTGGLSAIFDWGAILGDVISKSKEYANIQNVVNQVEKVLAQVLNALAPVINTLLRVFGFFANVVIDVYNIFVRLVGLLGIHLQLLDQINTQFSDLSHPLIAITHDLPTLNELASGKIAPLSQNATSVSVNDFLNPVTSAMQSSTLGGGLLGQLIEVVAGIAGLKLILGALGIGGGLNSAGGGILGFFKGLFNFGGGNPAGSGSVDIGVDQANQAALDNTPLANSNVPGPVSFDGPDGITDALGDNTAATTDLSDGISKGDATGTNGLIGSTNSLATVLSYATDAMQLFSGLSKGGSFSQTLGGLGGAVGTIFGGPIGGAIGDALGTLIGSLFGPKWGPASNYPDRSNTGPYGQFVANYQGGTPSVNGQTFTAGAGYNTANGGTSLANQMEQWANETLGQTLTPALQALRTQIEALMKNNSSANLGIANEHNGVFTLGDSATISVTDLMNLGQSFIDAVSTGLGQLSDGFTSLVNSAAPIIRGLSTTGNGLVSNLSGGAAGSPVTPGAPTVNAPGITNQIMTAAGTQLSNDDIEAISEAQAEATARTLRSRGYLITRAA